MSSVRSPCEHMFVSRRKELEYDAARRLRREGMPVRRIADRLGVAQSSVSVWVRDVVVLPHAVLKMVSTPVQPEQQSGEPTDEATKHCSRCDRIQPHAAFNRTGPRRTAWCRSCYRTYHQSRRAINRAAKTAGAARARAHVLGVLRSSACRDCGLNDPVVLEFDHVQPKRSTVAKLVGDAATIKRLNEEIARCEVVCVNCHRRRTANRGGHRRGLVDWRDAPPPPGRTRARNMAVAYTHLEASGCVDCGLRDLCVLDFDHVTEKTANVTDLARSGCSVERLLREIALCEVRCANCHRRRTAAGAGYYRTRPSPP